MPTIGPVHPTTQELGRRFATLRLAAEIDAESFAAQAKLDPSIVHELEAGTRSWTLAELFAYADVLSVRLSSVFAEWDAASAQ